MYCSFCGKELKENANFCSFCGTRVSGEAVNPEGGVKISFSGIFADAPKPKKADADPIGPKQTDAPAHDSVISVSAEDAPQKPKKKRRKAKIVISIIAAVLALALLSAGGIAGFVLLTAPDVTPLAIEPYIGGKNSDAHFCYGSNDHIKFTGGVREAVLTPDRERTVVLKEDGKFFWQKGEDGKAESIGNVSNNTELEFVGVGNDRFFYVLTVIDANGAITSSSLTRYTFKGKKTAHVDALDKCDGMVLSDGVTEIGEGSAAYAKDGSIHVLAADSDKTVSIASYDKNSDFALHDVSDDGKAVVWSVTKENKRSVYLWKDGTTVSVESADVGEYQYPYHIHAAKKAKGVYVLASESSDTVYLTKKDSKTLTSVKLAGKVAGGAVYSADGTPISDCKRFDGKDAFYVAVVGNEGSADVYLADAEGKTVKVAGGAKDVEFCKKGVLYIDKSDTAHIARVKTGKMKLDKDLRLETGVKDIVVTENRGDSVYFSKETSGKLDLYRYSVKKHEKALVASNIDEQIYVSTDSKSVYYFTGCEGEAHGKRGTLCVNNGKKTKEIARSVAVSSLTSHLSSGELDDGSIWYESYVSALDNGYTCNFMHFNGKKSKQRLTNASRRYPSDTAEDARDAENARYFSFAKEK